MFALVLFAEGIWYGSVQRLRSVEGFLLGHELTALVPIFFVLATSPAQVLLLNRAVEVRLVERSWAGLALTRVRFRSFDGNDLAYSFDQSPAS